MTHPAKPTAQRKPRRKKKREPSPFCRDPRQTDLETYLHDRAKREAFAKLDEAIGKALEEAKR